LIIQAVASFVAANYRNDYNSWYPLDVIVARTLELTLSQFANPTRLLTALISGVN